MRVWPCCALKHFLNLYMGSERDSIPTHFHVVLAVTESLYQMQGEGSEQRWSGAELWRCTPPAVDSCIQIVAKAGHTAQLDFRILAGFWSFEARIRACEPQSDPRFESGVRVSELDAGTPPTLAPLIWKLTLLSLSVSLQIFAPSGELIYCLL